MHLRSSVTVVLLLAAAALTSGCGDDRDTVPPPGGEPGTTSASATSGGGGEGGAGGGGSTGSISSSVSSASTADATSTGVGGEGGGGGGGEPTCADLVLNGDETDVDCGGGCPLPCGDGLGCAEDEDCLSELCGEDDRCTAPSCTDELLNGEEGDVDCGGSCEPCGAGKSCNGPGDCASELCTGSVCVCPSGMTTVPIAGGGSYCMDPTEVTYLQYDAFLTSSPVADIPGCEFNAESYTPTALWPPEPDPDLASAPNYIYKPVRYVDWCDAAAYCQREGKRLCGSILGGPTPQGEVANPDVDQWYNACSAHDINEYPYGSEFNNGATCTSSATSGPPSSGPNLVYDINGQILETCRGGYSNLYQLSGNVAEWQDSCDAVTGATDSCFVRGGSFTSTTPEELLCSAAEGIARDTTAADIGFRCCQ